MNRWKKDLYKKKEKKGFGEPKRFLNLKFSTFSESKPVVEIIF